VLGHVGPATGQVTAALRLQDGTQVSQAYRVLPGQGGAALVIGTLDAAPPSVRSPLTAPRPAVLELRNASGAALARQELDVLGANDQDTRPVTLYWLTGETLRPIQRRIPKTDRIGSAALEELLWGPAPRDGGGLSSAISTPQEVLAYAGRDATWGPRVTLRQLTVRDGVATADFSRELGAYGGGAARIGLIRQQITRTLQQFSTVREVRIAIEGDVAGALQPQGTARTLDHANGLRSHVSAVTSQAAGGPRERVGY